MADPREQPVYSVSEAASYLGMPVATLRSWVLGRRYQTTEGEHFFQPLVDVADKKHRRLSFYNLVEAFTLNAMRRTDHRVSMPSIRKALNYVKRRLGEPRPLPTENFLPMALTCSWTGMASCWPFPETANWPCARS